MKVRTVIVLILAALAAAAASPLSAEEYLIKLPKQDVALIPAFLLPQVRGIQELESCWLARMDDKLYGGLAGRGISPEVLDPNPEGKAYFLVRTSGPRDEAILSGLGQVHQLENRVFLFSFGLSEARGLLPQSFAVKRLALDNRLTIRAQALPSPARPRKMPALQQKAGEDALISSLVGQVSKASLSQDIIDLQNFQTRYASTPNCEAAGTALHDYFESHGLPADYQSFQFSSYTSRNIVATLSGNSTPSQEVIVCAHYDDTSNHPTTDAPGADDNASGTAAVMEIARVLAGHSFDFTVKFICFSAEEWGLYGSEYYARQAATHDEKIIGVINLDMVSYAPQLPLDLNLYINDSSGWLADRFSAAALTYAPLDLDTILDPSATWSDHSSFWDQGYSALCGIESSDNPYYHTTNDTFSTLNMDFTTSVTRAALAAVADLAQPTDVVPPPTGVRAQSQVSSSLFEGVKTVFLGWDAGPVTVSGYNVYRTTTPHGNYQKLNSAPLTSPSYIDNDLDPETTYYYVVTSVDNQGRESNFSEEVSDDENNGTPIGF